MRISDWSSDVCSSDLRSAACSCAGRNRSNLAGVPIHFAQRVQYLVDGDRPLVAGRAPDGGIALHGIGVRSPGCKDGALHLRFQLGMMGHFEGALKMGERSEEHKSEIQSLMRISYAGFCLKKKKQT